jgi:hypothetical protein
MEMELTDMTGGNLSRSRALGAASKSALVVVVMSLY